MRPALPRAKEPDGDDALRALWLSRLMFGWLADAQLGTSHFTETRSYEDFVTANERERPE